MMRLWGIGQKHSATVAFCKTIALRILPWPAPAIAFLYRGPAFIDIIFGAVFPPRRSGWSRASALDTVILQITRLIGAESLGIISMHLLYCYLL
jgi:hypothetical protein